VSPAAPPPGSDPVRAARELLKPALLELQRIKAPPPFVTRVLDRVAAATSALYAAETEATTPAGVNASLVLALDELTRALDALHERPPQLHALDSPATSVARALAVIYPRVRVSERQRRAAVLAEAVPNDERRALVAMADRLEAERRITPLRVERAVEQRTAGQRVRVEVDVGVLSASNFYAGVAADVSAGGVFVSTTEPLREGTEVALYFTLDGGHTLHAEGLVRWTRPKGGELPPGMGVAFSRLSDDDRRAIADFCSNRPPLFHD
jgi:uncharacterized protein (TIGR02266 family)